MERVREAVKRRAKAYHERRIFGETQIKYFLLVSLLLIGVGLFVEFGYYSTIGHLGQQIAFEILKVHLIKLAVILSYAYGVDCLCTILLGGLSKSIKEMLLLPFKRPAFLFSCLLILMFSLDAPITVFCISIAMMTLLSQNTKHGYTFYHIHPVLIGYLVGVVGIHITNINLGLVELPPTLIAPYMTLQPGELSEMANHFLTEYYSLSNVIFGIFEGSMCFTLIIPLLLTAVFLMKRTVIDYKVTLTYVFVYLLGGILLSFIYQMPTLQTELFLLNGAVLITGIFILPDRVTLTRYISHKYFYSICCGLLSLLGAYYVHFMFAPYGALLMIQLVTLLVDGVKKIVSYRK